jgi:uncharacterized protein
VGHGRTLARPSGGGGFPPEAENGSIGALSSASLTDSLHPSFEPWFRSLLPDVPYEGAREVLALLSEGATVAFVARYRRERTGGLGADAVRRTAEARDRFDRIVSRQAIIAESIERHAGISDELRARILATFDPDALEDLYHPYRQQKKNRALVAREAGLSPLAEWIWTTGHGTETPQEGQTLDLWAFTFRNEEKGIADAKAATEGARDILVERLASDPDLRAAVRRAYFEGGHLRAVKTDKAKPGGKFEPYFAFEEAVASLREPAGAVRYLAVRRGQSEGELQVSVGGRSDDPDFEARLVAAFEAAACTVPDAPGAEVLRHAGRIAFKNDVRTSIENEVHRTLKDAADAAASRAFAESVRQLLLEPPFGEKAVLGIDPGTKNGCRAAAVDGKGALVGTAVVHLQSDEQKAEARETLARLVREAGVLAVAVGSGSGGRETEVFTRGALRAAGIDVPVVLVSEAASSAWSTGEAARAELPEVEPPMRTAVSLARRLQDPMAELVKVEPRALGTGQYPHDVAHAAMQRAFDGVVEGCISRVGVDLNTAPLALLARVPGLGPGLAAAILEHRAKQGPFRSRRQLLDLPRVSARAFEQAAGFLRVRGGEHPLDVTGIHPERYPELEAFAAARGRSVGDLLGAGAALVREDGSLAESLGVPTRDDVVAELERAGGDPRGPFAPFSFREDVQKLEDLKAGLVCPGIVTNVMSFGAFVDVGVHHDGLVHVSQLGRSFAKEPREVVHPGERVEVRVLKVDLEKKQISLTMRKPPERRPAPKPAKRPDRRVEAQPVAAADRPGDAHARPRRPERPRREGPRREGPPGDHRPRRPGPRPDSPSARPAAPALERRPGGPPPDRRTEPRPDPRRPAFNNPFAVLAGLRVPPKK